MLRVDRALIIAAMCGCVENVFYTCFSG